MWLNFFRGALLCVVGALAVYRDVPWPFVLAIFGIALWFLYQAWREVREAE
jgi:hypothetical protein